MTLTGPNRDEVFQWDPDEPELMKAMVLSGVQVRIPVTDNRKGKQMKTQCEFYGEETRSNKFRGMHYCNDKTSEYYQCELNLKYNCCPRGLTE